MKVEPKNSSLFILFFLSFSVFSYSQKIYELNGRVIDFDSGFAIQNVSVKTKTSSYSVTTNKQGYFKLMLPYGYHAIITSHPGYTNNSATFNVRGPLEVTIRIKKKADNMLDEVIVNAMVRQNRVNTAQMSVVTVNPEQLRRNPVVFGEPDIIKALSVQPGITTAGEGAGGFSVRGGNADQNLVLVDGAPLFNTSHLLGFYSSVSPDLVENITLYKGTAPATYGGRLSSLLDIGIKEGRNQGIGFTGGLSPVSARIFSEGSLIKNKLSFAAGTRVAYPDLLMNLFPKTVSGSRAFFYDAIARAVYRFDSSHKIALTYYRSFDRFQFDSALAYKWKSELVSLIYKGKLSESVNLTLSSNYSGFNSDLEGLEKNYESVLQSYIQQRELKAGVVYKPNPSTDLTFGLNGINYRILPSKEIPAEPGSNIINREVEKESGREMAAYLNSNLKFGRYLSMEAGLRLVKYDYLGPKSIYHYEDGQPKTRGSVSDTSFYANRGAIHSYQGLEPRLSLRLLLSQSSSVKLGFHRSQQFLHLITNTTAISPVDFWKLSDPHLKQQKGFQYSAGYFRDFNGFDLSIEGYYRNLENQLEYRNGALLLLNPAMETALLNAEGYAFGSEFSISKTTGNTTGQLNYTYSKTKIRLITDFESEAVNGGQYYNSNADRPHAVSFQTRTKLNGGWTFNTNFLFMSGRPATYPDGTYSINNNIVTNYSVRNRDRLPDYHRLDISFSCVTRRFNSQKNYSIWNFSVYNVYGRANAYSIFFRRESTALNAYRLSVLGSVLPSITWNYHF